MHKFRAQTVLQSVVLCGLLLGLLPASSGLAQSAPVTYQRYDVHIDVRTDGDFDVRIVQQVEFHEAFADAYYEVRHDNIEAVVNTQVYEFPGEFPGEFPVDSRQIDPSQLETLATHDAVESTGTFIEWQYAEAAPGDIRTFVIDYRIQGGLWIYSQSDFLRWDAINRDRSGVMIEQAQVSVRLPAEIPVDSISASSEGAAMESKTSEDNHLRIFESSQLILDGIGVNIEVHFAHGYVSSDVQPWQKAIDHENLAINLSRVDTTLEVRENGQLHVTEQLRMKVERGTLYVAYRTLDFLYLDNVYAFEVQQDGVTYSPVDSEDELWRCKACYLSNSNSSYDSWAQFSPTSEQVEIDPSLTGNATVSWGLPAMSEGDESTFVIDYVVDGAIRISDTAQSFVWDVLPDYQIPIGAASVRLILPDGVDAKTVSIEESRKINPQLQEDGSLLLRHDRPLAASDRWSLVVTLPAAATSAGKPEWQAHLESAIAEQKTFQIDKARKELAARTGGIFSGVLAGLGALLSWLTWGRRRIRQTLYGYLSQPPSDLAPALVAYLVDQKTSEKGVLASIFHLAPLGLLHITFGGDIRIRRLREKPITFQNPLLDAQQKSVTLPSHLDYLFNEIILPATPFDQDVPLNTIEPTLRDKLPHLYTLIGRELQSLVIHDRGRNLFATPQFSTVLWFLFAAVLFFWATSGSLRIEWLLILGVASLALLGWRLWSQEKEEGTGQLGGASDTSRWLAFKNYLVNLKSYGDLAAAQTILDRYFAYAVAFGIETVVLEQAESLGSNAPTWLPIPKHDDTPSIRPSSQPSTHEEHRPTTQPASSSRDGSLPRVPGTDNNQEESRSPAPTQPRPSLSGMSRNLAAAMASNSSSMSQLLSSAAGSDVSTDTKITLNGEYYSRELSWKAGTSNSQVIDDIMRQALRDTTPPPPPPPPPPPMPTYSSHDSGDSGGGSFLDSLFSGDGSSSSSSSGSSWSSSSRSSSSGGFGSSSPSSSSSSSSSSSGGGGRSGFGRR